MNHAHTTIRTVEELEAEIAAACVRIADLEHRLARSGLDGEERENSLRGADALHQSQVDNMPLSIMAYDGTDAT